MAWRVDRTEEGAHVWPTQDLHAHQLSRKCACHPSVEDVWSDDRKIFKGVIVIHNSWDGRELLEHIVAGRLN